MRQFYLETDPDHPPRTGDRVTLDAEESRHLKTVLRGGRDETLILVDGRGRRYAARSLAGGRGPAELEITSVETDPDETAAPRLVLACAVVKGRRFEWVLEKAVELGAHRVVPLRTERGVIEAGAGRNKRWRALLVSALKQSGRTTLPALDDARGLEEVLDGCEGDPVLFGAVPGEVETPPWTDLVTMVPDEMPGTLTLVIGPEGGWTPAERSLLQERGARAVGLGPHVLRTETAAVVGLAALQQIRRSWLAGPA